VTRRTSPDLRLGSQVSNSCLLVHGASLMFALASWTKADNPPQHLHVAGGEKLVRTPRIVVAALLSLPLAASAAPPATSLGWLAAQLGITSRTLCSVSFHPVRRSGWRICRNSRLRNKEALTANRIAVERATITSADDCAKILAQVAQAVGMKEWVAGTTVRIYPTSSDGLWFRIQTPPGESPLVDSPTAGESSPGADI
jgi:hypothetical protein